MPPPISVLCVAEKPSLAGSIAQHLSDGSCVERKATQSVHEFSGRFKNQPAHFKVTSVIGHVYTTDFAEAYQSWELDPARLFDAPTVRMESNPRARICEHLRQEARSCHYLVLWLDCDREGENICFEVMDSCARQLQRPPSGSPNQQQIYRARFSAITAEAIKAAMRVDRLVAPNANEAAAVDARQELDLKVGVAFTRFQTRYFGGRYRERMRVVSYGPCQTPTLGFCVARHTEICEFKPEDYWALRCSVGQPGSSAASGGGLSVAWARKRLFERSAATDRKSVV